MTKDEYETKRAAQLAAVGEQIGNREVYIEYLIGVIVMREQEAARAFRALCQANGGFMFD